MRFFKEISSFIKDLIRGRNIIFELTKKDFQVRYLGSYLGIIWAFIQPVVYVLVLWFIFESGFKAAPVSKVPYVLWLTSGMIPWFFFNETITRGTTSIIENAFLVKKVVFRVSTLPITKILSALVVHVFFIVILFVIFILEGYWPGVHSLQIIYYVCASVFFLLSVLWITSAFNVFIKDVTQIMGILMQIGFWMTPIFWSLKNVPEAYRWIFLFNPFLYVIDGFRNALIEKKWFWEAQPLQTLYFWLLSLVLFIAGIFIFRKLRPHFADVL